MPNDIYFLNNIVLEATPTNDSHVITVGAVNTAISAATANLAPASHSHAGADITSGTVSASYLPAATTSASGIVQLASTISSNGTGVPDAGTVYSFVSSGYSATGHSHDRIKNGSNPVLAPSLTAQSYACVTAYVAPPHNASTTYSKGDFCTKEGKFYMWINNTSGSGANKTPPNATYWQEVTVLDVKATTTNRGLMQVGNGLVVSDGVVSVSPSAVQGLMGMGVYTKIAEMDTSTIVLEDDTAIYTYEIEGVTSLSFDTSHLTMTTGTAITFELYLIMPSTVYTISFPANANWINNEVPSMPSASKTYMFCFRSLDGGTTWLGNKEGAY